MAAERTDRNLSRRDALKAGAAGAGLVALGLPMLGGCGDSGGSDVPASYRYDVGDAATIDPARLTWRQVHVWPSKVTGWVDAALMADGRSLALAGGSAVHWLDLPDESLPGKWRLPAEATALAAAGDGLLIAMHDRLERWVNEAPEQTWPSLGERAHITSIAIDGDDIYVADAGNRQVVRYRGRDEVWRAGDFVVPSPYFDVAVRDGALWVANTGRHKLERFDATGERVESFGETGMALDRFCGCCNPCHFTILPDGRFVTAEKGLNRVKVLSPTGDLVGVVCGAEQLGINVDQPICATPECSGPAGPIPVAASDGRLIVAHPVTGRIHLFQEASV